MSILNSHSSPESENMTSNFRSRRREMANRRTGVLYNINENGTARLIFNPSRTSFEGVLETHCGEVISLRGKVTPNSSRDSTPKEETPSTSQVMDIHVVDGEAGNSFHLVNVPVLVDGQTAHIVHAAISFDSEERMVGMKADREIQQFMDPRMVSQLQSEVFVGPMKVQVATNHRTKPGIRRESICDTDVRILEVSDDFLA